MTTHETKTWTCDNPGCKKSEKRHPDEKILGYVSPPDDPWLVVSVGGHWQTVFDEAAGSRYDACSPECAIKILEKAIERLKNAPKSEPDPRVL